ncbi:MAG: hypothetical protein RMH97_11465, partial [Verrucomicrobiales bacterium]|nr:hypothetical protein [Verrucomicrobiales bacterium]
MRLLCARRSGSNPRTGQNVTGPRPPKVRLGLIWLIGCLANSAAELVGAQTNWSYKVDLALKEAYDSNVYLQDTAPATTAPRAFPAKKESWVTTLTPKLSLTYTAGAHFNAAGFYTPDIAFFHSAHSEDHVA